MVGREPASFAVIDPDTVGDRVARLDGTTLRQIAHGTKAGSNANPLVLCADQRGPLGQRAVTVPHGADLSLIDCRMHVQRHLKAAGQICQRLKRPRAHARGAG
jgi:hypothetical protein